MIWPRSISSTPIADVTTVKHTDPITAPGTVRSSHLFSVRLGVIAAILISYFVAIASSADPGRDIAERLCAHCHAIAGPGPSPIAAAPAFSGIGRRINIDHLAEALAEGILTGHGPVEMPEIVLDAAEIDALLAYLHSIQE